MKLITIRVTRGDEQIPGVLKFLSNDGNLLVVFSLENRIVVLRSLQLTASVLCCLRFLFQTNVEALEIS